MRNGRIRMLAKSAALLTLCIASASVLAGCGDQGASDRTERPSGAAAEDPSGGSDRTETGQPDKAAQTPRESDGAKSPIGGTGGAASAADGTGGSGVEPTAAGDPPDARPAEDGGWFTDPPALLGLSVGASEAEAKERFGEPSDIYRLYDPPVTVLEYEGFAVGIGSDGRVRYLAIDGEGVSAGIGDLAVGDAADEAIAALGEPDQASDTVLLYRRDDVSLKFDIDPETKRIASIILFGEP